MNKLRYILILCLLSYLNIYSQNGVINGGSNTKNITGRITDEINKEPIGGVLISLVGSNINTVSDKNGEFNLSIEEKSINKDTYIWIEKPLFKRKAVGLYNCDSLNLTLEYYTPSSYSANISNMTISGRLINKNNNPIENANVSLTSTILSTKTDSDGRYTITIPYRNVEEPFFLLFEKNGYFSSIRKRNKKFVGTKHVGQDKLQVIRNTRLTFRFIFFNVQKGTIISKKLSDNISCLLNGEMIKFHWVNNFYVATLEDVPPERDKVTFNFVHDYFIQRDYTIQLTDSDEYSSTIRLNPKLYPINLNIVDDSRKAVKNAQLYLNKSLVVNSDNNGNIIDTLSLLPEETLFIHLKNIYSADKMRVVFSPDSLPDTLVVKRSPINIFLDIRLGDKLGQSVFTDIVTSPNYELMFQKNEHDTSLDSKLYHHYKIVASEGDEVNLFIDTPDYMSTERSFKVDGDVIDYYFEDIILDEIIYTGQLRFNSPEEIIKCEIINPDKYYNSNFWFSGKKELNLNVGRYTIIFTKDGYSSIVIDTTIIRSQMIDIGNIFLKKLKTPVKFFVTCESKDQSVDVLELLNSDNDNVLNYINRDSVINNPIELLLEADTYRLKITKHDYLDCIQTFNIVSNDSIVLFYELHKRSRDINIILNPPDQYDYYFNKIFSNSDTTANGIIRIDNIKYGVHSFSFFNTSNPDSIRNTKNIAINNNTDNTLVFNYDSQPSFNKYPSFTCLSPSPLINTVKNRILITYLKNSFLISPDNPTEGSIISLTTTIQYNKTIDFGLSIDALVNSNEYNYYVEEFQPFVKFKKNFKNHHNVGVYTMFMIPINLKNKYLSRGMTNLESRFLYSYENDIELLEYSIISNIGIKTNRTIESIKYRYSVYDGAYALFTIGGEIKLKQYVNRLQISFNYTNYQGENNVNNLHKYNLNFWYKITHQTALNIGFKTIRTNNKNSLLPIEKKNSIDIGLLVNMSNMGN